MGKKSLDLSIIIVNYNTRELLKACLRSVFAETDGLDFEVFVVDNSSSDGSAKMVKNLFPRVHLIQNSRNLGFAEANNQAILKSQGRYVLLLNPDTVILSKALAKLVWFMDIHPDAGAAGCMLLNPGGSIQYSMRNFPTFLNQLSECFFLHRLFPRVAFFGEMVCDLERYEQTRIVDWVSGAALIVRKEAISQIGLLDESFFLYSEEKDWCYRAWQVGWKIYYYPEAQFIHHHGESGTDPNLFSHLLRSRVKFFQNYNSPARTWLFKKIVALRLLIRISLWFILSLIDWRGSRARNKLKVYLKGLAVTLLTDK